MLTLHRTNIAPVGNVDGLMLHSHVWMILGSGRILHHHHHATITSPVIKLTSDDSGRYFRLGCESANLFHNKNALSHSYLTLSLTQYPIVLSHYPLSIPSFRLVTYPLTHFSISPFHPLTHLSTLSPILLLINLFAYHHPSSSLRIHSHQSKK